jgi:HK97 family phage portal protein
MGKALSVFAALAGVFRNQALATPVDSGRGWFTIRDWPLGNWQSDGEPINNDRVLSNWAVYSCISLISADISKLCLDLLTKADNGVWEEAESSAFGPVIKKPNHFQTRQQFIELWLLSKLIYGNTYVLKAHDRRGLVTGMYVLDPQRVTPLVATNGAIFYRIGQDNLSGVTEEMEAVPAIDMIHDRGPCLFHPLVGIPPLFASALAASQGSSIQKNSEKFFKNMSRPSGILVAPGEISDPTAARLKREWEANYGGEKIGKVAVLGDGLKYEAININPVDAQLAEQLGLTAKMICSSFHVPPFKIGLSELPAGQKVEDMNQIYYADCLQVHVEAIEALLMEGLYLNTAGRPLKVAFDLEDLMRMDNASMVRMLTDSVKGSIMAPNEARRRRNLPPVEGGDSIYMQQQNYSLEALAKRDAQEDPFGKTASSSPASSPAEDPEEPEDPEDPEDPEEPSPPSSSSRIRSAEGITADLLDRIAKGLA